MFTDLVGTIIISARGHGNGGMGGYVIFHGCPSGSRYEFLCKNNSGVCVLPKEVITSKQHHVITNKSIDSKQYQQCSMFVRKIPMSIYCLCTIVSPPAVFSLLVEYINHQHY
jgi:hypothetical protein